MVKDKASSFLRVGSGSGSSRSSNRSNSNNSSSSSSHGSSGSRRLGVSSSSSSHAQCEGGAASPPSSSTMDASGGSKRNSRTFDALMSPPHGPGAAALPSSIPAAASRTSSSSSFRIPSLVGRFQPSVPSSPTSSSASASTTPTASGPASLPPLRAPPPPRSPPSTLSNPTPRPLSVAGGGGEEGGGDGGPGGEGVRPSCPALSSSQGEIESRGKVVVSSLTKEGINARVKKTMDVLERYGELRRVEQQQVQQWVGDDGEVMVGMGKGGGRESEAVLPSPYHCHQHEREDEQEQEKEEGDKQQQQEHRPRQPHQEQQQKQHQQQQQQLEQQLLCLQQEHRSLRTQFHAVQHGASVLGEEAARANEELDRCTELVENLEAHCLECEEEIDTLNRALGRVEEVKEDAEQQQRVWEERCRRTEGMMRLVLEREQGLLKENERLREELKEIRRRAIEYEGMVAAAAAAGGRRRMGRESRREGGGGREGGPLAMAPTRSGGRVGKLGMFPSPSPLPNVSFTSSSLSSLSSPPTSCASALTALDANTEARAAVGGNRAEEGKGGSGKRLTGRRMFMAVPDALRRVNVKGVGESGRGGGEGRDGMGEDGPQGQLGRPRGISEGPSTVYLAQEEGAERREEGEDKEEEKAQKEQEQEQERKPQQLVKMTMAATIATPEEEGGKEGGREGLFMTLYAHPDFEAEFGGLVGTVFAEAVSGIGGGRSTASSSSSSSRSSSSKTASSESSSPSPSFLLHPASLSDAGPGTTVFYIAFVCTGRLDDPVHMHALHPFFSAGASIVLFLIRAGRGSQLARIQPLQELAGLPCFEFLVFKKTLQRGREEGYEREVGALRSFMSRAMPSLGRAIGAGRGRAVEGVAGGGAVASTSQPSLELPPLTNFLFDSSSLSGEEQRHQLRHEEENGGDDIEYLVP